MGSIIEAGIDYIAMSMPSDLRGIQAFEASCYRALDLIAQHGNIGRPGSFQGYEGLWVGGAFVGSRPDGVHCHIPGSWAGKLWSQLHTDGVKYSRFDLQVTYQFDEPRPNYGHEMRLAARAVNDLRPTKQKRKIRYVGEDEGGYTLYVGSRGSNHFCRLYDKGAETQEELYINSWRFEAELHGNAATQAAQYVWSGSKGQARIAASTCWRYFNDRGILPPWTKEDEDNAVQPQTQPQTDIERKLHWLETQVRPTITKLLEILPRDILDKALGIGGSTEELPPESSMV